MKFNINKNRIIFYLQNKENNVQNSVSTHFNRRMFQACQFKGGYSKLLIKMGHKNNERIKAFDA